VAAEIVPASIALWKPFSNKGTTLLKRDVVCVHTMVGSLGGSYSWANQAGNSYWHFGMAGSGETWQCHDLRYRSAANLEGNPYVIPIETADHGFPFGAWSGKCGDVPAWTNAQVDKLVELISWLCVRYGIPPTIVPDTQAGRRGLAYHRQGVPNSPEWKTGNLRWSSSVGKCCPDWRRIEQFKTKVVPGVRALVRGEDMPLNDDDKTIIRNILKQEIPGLVQDAVQKGGVAEASLEARVAEGVEASLGDALRDAVGVTQGTDGRAAAQVRARAREGAGAAILEALDDPAVQEKLRALLAPPVPPA
jgi:hypothetical protein